MVLLQIVPSTLFMMEINCNIFCPIIEVSTVSWVLRVNPVGSASLVHLGSQEPQGPKETWGHQDPKAVLDFKDQEVVFTHTVIAISD